MSMHAQDRAPAPSMWRRYPGAMYTLLALVIVAAGAPCAWQKLKGLFEEEGRRSVPAEEPRQTAATPLAPAPPLEVVSSRPWDPTVEVYAPERGERIILNLALGAASPKAFRLAPGMRVDITSFGHARWLASGKVFRGGSLEIPTPREFRIIKENVPGEVTLLFR